MSDLCLICEKPVPDYRPNLCCSGNECGCMGQPTNPCVCSALCDDALFAHIGMPYDDRRRKAGIEKYTGTRAAAAMAKEDSHD